MLKVLKQNILDRWDNLPMVLREALAFDANSDFIWKTCREEFVSDEKIYSISRIVGFVILGFLHPEDMAKEVRDELSIDIRVATSISDAINQRIFAPIRANIDKVYNPISSEPTTPKILEEVRPPVTGSVPPPAPAQKSAPIPAPIPVIAKSVPVPSTPKPEPVKPATEKTAASLDEFARIGKIAATAPSPTPTPAPAPTPAPKPVFLQTESVARPIPNAPDFKMPTIAENIMGGRKEFEPLPTKTAVVEFGGMPVPKPAAAAQFSAGPRVTVVRYGNENSAAPAMPPKPEPMRTITEITPDMLKTAAPTPKTPPRPSFAPLSQTPVPSPVMQKPPTPPMPKPPAPNL